MFTIRNQGHVPDTEPTLGARTGFGENFMASFNRQYSVDSALGYEAELYDAYLSNLERASNLSGEDLSIGMGLGESKRTELNKRLIELKSIYPDIKTFDEIDTEHREAAQELINEQERIGARSSLSGWAGEFLGTMAAGAIPWRDPIYAAGLLFGAGVGRSLATKLLVEGAIGGSIETVQQTAFTSPRYRREGLEGNNALMNILAAAVGGAVIRGAFEVPGPAFRAVERKFRPQAVRDRQINGALSTIFGRKVDASNLEGYATDKEVLELVEELPASRERDLAATLLRQKVKETGEAPTPRTRSGSLDKDAEIQKATADLTGEKPAPRVAERAEESEAARLNDADAKARESNPELFKRLDEATEERDKLQRQLEALESSRVTEEDVDAALAREGFTGEPVDAERVTRLKNKIRELEEVRDARTSKGKRAGLTRAIKGVQKRLDEAQEVNEASPQKRAAVRKQLEKDYNVREAELRTALRSLRGKIGGLTRSTRNARRKAAEALKAEQKPIAATRTAGDATVEELEEFTEHDFREETLDVYIAGMQPDENGDMELGIGKKYNQRFLEVETDEGLKTAEELLAEIKEDADLDAAVRECGTP